MTIKYPLITILTLAIGLSACGKLSKQPAQKTTERTYSVDFSADSAYHYIAQQVQFGPRVPGTQAHQQCGDFLVAQLHRFGALVEEQTGTLPDYLGNPAPIRNIIGHLGAESSGKRLLICAHWDCRPWADHDANPSNHHTPVLGANDAASGVGVALELARQWQLLNTKGVALLPVDIVFFDTEDMGTPEWFDGQQRDNTWCLGSQLWSASVKPNAEQYTYGILLDMIGAPDACFYQEYFSMQYAASYTRKVWQRAVDLGHARYFRQQPSYPITDDHYYVNVLAGIPCLDIIHYDALSGTGFPAYWHTVNDDMSHVSTATLQAVGTTLMTLICN